MKINVFCGLCESRDFPSLLGPMGQKSDQISREPHVRQLVVIQPRVDLGTRSLPGLESPCCCLCRGGRSTRLPRGERSQAAGQPWQCIANALNLPRRTQPPFRGPKLKVTLHTWSQTCQPQVSQQLWEDPVPYPKVLRRRHH